MTTNLEILTNGKKSKNPEYDAYRETERWKKLRRAVMLRAKGKCEICRRREGTDLGHLTYDNFFNESMSDMLWLCRQCHTKLDERG